MKTARDRALDIVHRIVGEKTFTRGALLQILQDKAETGETFRKMLREIEEGIEADRRDLVKARSPS